MAAIRTTGSKEISEIQSTVMTMPHKKWRNVSTFPKHCHDGNQLNVIESFLPDNYENAVEEFLRLVRERMAAK